MKNPVLPHLYLLGLFLLLIFSYGFIDVNSPFRIWPFLYRLVNSRRGLATAIYLGIVSFLFGFYGWVLLGVVRKRLTAKEIGKLIMITAAVLFFSYPAFSGDIFNYLATAKMAFFYRENPYVVMPIEIPNEPMLAFMHAANKTALYGPAWILLTALPYFAGRGNLFFTIFTFKALVALFYLGSVWLIWKLSRRNLWSLAFFSLNPLVVIETLVSAHNDVVMMFFGLLAFYLLQKKKTWLALFSLAGSILVKFSTVFLLPVFIGVLYGKLFRKKIAWPKIWRYSVYCLAVIFLLSPLREELYSWYLIWPLTFIALLPPISSLTVVSFSLAFGLMLRFAPFLYTRDWAGTTPLIKKIVTLVPPGIGIAWFQLQKIKQRIGSRRAG